MRGKNVANRAVIKSNRIEIGRVGIYALVALCVVSGIRAANAGRQERDLTRTDGAGLASPQVAVSPTATPTPTPTPTPSPTPTATPIQQIDGEGTIAGPNGRQAQFFIIDVENEQVTNQFLEGEFGYSDHRSHVTFTTGNITTVTVNGNQAAFTGMGTIGGKHRQRVNFTVSVTGNQAPATGDTFNISLSNGYSASGNLTSGSIRIAPIDPQGE